MLWVAAYTAAAYKNYMGGCFIYTKKIKLVSKIKQYGGIKTKTEIKHIGDVEIKDNKEREISNPD